MLRGKHPGSPITAVSVHNLLQPSSFLSFIWALLLKAHGMLFFFPMFLFLISAACIIGCVTANGKSGARIFVPFFWTAAILLSEHLNAFTLVKGNRTER